MPAERAELDTLIQRFKGLRQIDQTAVLEQLPSDERDRVLVAMTERELARQAEQDAAGQADRRYAAYSPWLAKLVRGAEAGTLEGTTASAARALGEGHRLLASETQGVAPGLVGQLRGWFDRLFVLPPGEPR